jgi:hypothetical protein
MDFKLKPWACGPIAALAVALSVVACGGDSSDSSSTTSGTVTPTSSVYSGTVSGFGSVIVNRVRFETVGASTLDDDGAEVRLEDLRIGMPVTISGSADDSTGRGTATRLLLSHGTTGVITSINFETDTLVLLGQTVTTNTFTNYEGVTAFDLLEVGSVIEVYGVLQTDNTVLATLIERKNAPTGIRLVGRMSALDTTAKTFLVGGITVNYASPATVIGTLGNDKRVTIKAVSDALVGNVLTASSVKVNEGAANGEPVLANTYLKLEGVVETLPDSNGLLTVSGTQVNVSSATGAAIITAVGQLIEVKGTWDGSVLQATKVEEEDEGPDRNELYGAINTAPQLVGTDTLFEVHGVPVSVPAVVVGSRAFALGNYVEIKGNVVGGVLIATRVEIKTGSDAVGSEFEDYGVISEFSSASRFRVNGVLVDASSARFEDGAAGDLSDGDYVEIKGAQNASGVFVATKVEFKTRTHD